MRHFMLKYLHQPSKFLSAFLQANFGLLFTQSVACCAVMLVMTKAPVVAPALGYTGMFTIAGVFGLLGITSVCCLPGRLAPRASAIVTVRKHWTTNNNEEDLGNGGYSYEI